MNIREAETSDLDQLSKLFDSYRMFYGKESNIDISKKFLESRLSNKDLEKKADDMLFTMYEDRGIGLAATQVNIHERLIV